MCTPVPGGLCRHQAIAHRCAGKVSILRHKVKQSEAKRGTQAGDTAVGRNVQTLAYMPGSHVKSGTLSLTCNPSPLTVRWEEGTGDSGSWG